MFSSVGTSDRPNQDDDDGKTGCSTTGDPVAPGLALVAGLLPLLVRRRDGARAG